MRNRYCCNCGNCIRIDKGTYIQNKCAIDNHYIGYLQAFDGWCRRWKRDRKWDKENKQ